MRLRQQWLAFILGILACPLSAQPSRAEGAMAIGIPLGGAAIGFASGDKVNARNLDEASKLAVDYCKRSTLDNFLKATCKIVAMFRDDRLELLRLTPQVLDLAAGRSPRRVAHQTPFAGLAGCAAFLSEFRTFPRKHIAAIRGSP